MRKKALERREQEANFEHKKMNLSIEENPEYDKENKEVRAPSPKKQPYYDKYEWVLADYVIEVLGSMVLVFVVIDIQNCIQAIVKKTIMFLENPIVSKYVHFLYPIISKRNITDFDWYTEWWYWHYYI